jgi:hypothetical protein
MPASLQNKLSLISRLGNQLQYTRLDDRAAAHHQIDNAVAAV